VASRFERLHPQLFRERHPDSALWQWLVNGIAASPAWTPRQRAALLRRGGIEVRSGQVQQGCFFFSTQIEFGDWVWVNHRAYFDTRDWIRIGDRVGFGPAVMVLTSTHEPGDHENRRGRYTTAPVTIGAGSWIGARATIMPGVTIGEGVTVGAGSVVTRDCEPDGLYAGVPATRVKELGS
jgi:maltose O-acetyltransferase